MNLFALFDISGSALTAERQRAEVVAANMANSETTRTAQGGPYRRQEVVFSAAPLERPNFRFLLTGMSDAPSASVEGVRLVEVVNDPTPPLRRFEPSHPDADPEGYVSYPAINPVQEMVDLIGAARAYQLNVSALQATKQMIQQSLQILA
jgi:flagellar basal-body rod protein FlgC